MATYRRAPDPITGEPSEAGVVRLADGAFVPADPRNTDWIAYLAWLEAGNAPEPSATGATSFINR